MRKTARERSASRLIKIFFTTPRPACRRDHQQRFPGQADAPDAAALCRAGSRLCNAGKNMQVVVTVDMIRLYARRLQSLDLSYKLALYLTRVKPSGNSPAPGLMLRKKTAVLTGKAVV